MTIDLETTSDDDGAECLRIVLEEAFDQVMSPSGKGMERHGSGQELFEQSWLAIAKASGNGFLTGQAIKKLMEAAKTVGTDRYVAAAFERELLGAIAYTAFAIMHQRIVDGEASRIETSILDKMIRATSPAVIEPPEIG